MKWFGGVEAGGTKFVCMIGNDPENVIAETRFPTTTPEETLNSAVEFFSQHIQEYPLAGIGIGAFGPLDLFPDSPSYGQITTTPKLVWQQTDLLGWFSDKFGIPVTIDTDVNAACLAEQTWGAGRGLSNLLYLTVGTGIGGGGMVNGEMIHGLVHPEMGHMLIPHNVERDPFPGSCPYHGDCFEGLASGPAIQKRWGQPGQTLPPDHPAWDLEADYIALSLMNLICVLSPERIILGGGVLEQPALLPKIREKTVQHLNGYVQSPEIQEHTDRYITAPALGNRAGVLGSIALIAKHVSR